MFGWCSYQTANDTAPRHFKKGDWVIYWHKPTAMQTLSSCWAGPYVVIEKVSVVNYRIQLKPTGPSKVVHVDQLILDPCHQDRAIWVRDEFAHQIERKGDWCVHISSRITTDDSLCKYSMSNLWYRSHHCLQWQSSSNDYRQLELETKEETPSFHLLSTDLGWVNPNEVDSGWDGFLHKSLVVRKRNARLEDTKWVYSLYIGICWDDTRGPGVSTLFSYLHLIGFETLFTHI